MISSLYRPLASIPRVVTAWKHPCVLIMLLGLVSINSIAGETTRVFESELALQTLKQAMEKCLQKIDGTHFRKKVTTLGFDHRYTSDWLSPYDYDIYLSKTKNKQALVRIEGSYSHVLTMSRVLELEGIITRRSEILAKNKIYMPNKKSHWLAQSLNLLSPSLSLFYQAHNSPTQNLTRTLLYAFAYAVADSLAIGVGGTRFFTESFNAKANLAFITTWLSLNRGLGAVHSFHNIRGHNRLVQFGYTFPIP